MAMAELMPLSERSTAAATVSFPIGRKGARCSSCTSLNSDTSCCACTSETSWFRTSSREDACMGSGTEEPECGDERKQRRDAVPNELHRAACCQHNAVEDLIREEER